MALLLKQQRFLFVPLLVALALICASKAVGESFQQNYKVTWGKNHVFFLDNGAGFRSKLEYASGFFQMRIKTPNKDSLGVVTAVYV
ncbi:xyloglucan:xyloglucosyl transferase [Trifolium repens]|nr:xyloglucan:xyloglucosyl transferase [Trifolium repens]